MHSRHLLVALLAPLIARASIVPHFDSPNSSDAEIQPLPQSTTSFEVSCQADDEAFDVTFEVRQPSQPASCGFSTLLVNGQLLTQDWAGNGGWDWSGQGTSLITAESSINGLNHSIELQSLSKCLWAPDASKRSLTHIEDPHHRPSFSDEVIEVTSVRILSIDGQPSKSHSGFTVSFSQPDLRVLSALTAPDEFDAVITQSSQGELAASASPSVESETQKLKDLNAHYKHLQAAIDRQKSFVDKLTYNNLKASQPNFRDCDNFKCVVKTAFNRAKSCAKLAYLKMKPGHLNSAEAPLSDTYVHHHNGKVYFTIGADEKLIDDNSSESSSESGVAEGETRELPQPSNARAHIVAFVGAFASVLCVGCFSYGAIRRCANPRRKAEMAARREERRRAKEYRTLTRRKALQDFINSFRVTVPPVSNFEEKRGLVHAQESILEDAMQAEIHRLRLEAGLNPARVAEEGMVGSSSRSRRMNSLTNSDRPPSYTTNDENASNSGKKRQNRLRTGSGSDVTPDSSVAALSPRHSSETLRSEKSLI